MARVSPLDDLIDRVERLPVEEQAEVLAAARTESQGMLWVPNPGPQTQAYFSPADELLYGGEAGGGKSDFLIGIAINEHRVSQIFRLQHNDRVAIVRRLAEILAQTELMDGAKPPGYNGSEHIWTSKVPMQARGIHPIIEFGALSDPLAWQHYQGRAADAKLWDELTHFPRPGFETVNAWLRSTDPNQRCRIVAASNPPTTIEGLWVLDYFAAWVDDRHPNPAKPGELRYFANIKGEQVEVSRDWRGVSKDGLEIKPRSRTFIPASLADNPDLAETGYASTLAGLPEHLRLALEMGKWRSSFEDGAMQVIPTEWVLAAQQRWEEKQRRFDAGLETRGPMHALGVDPNGGGKARMIMAPRYGVFFGKLAERTSDKFDLKDPRVITAQIFTEVTDAALVIIDNTGAWGAGAKAILESNSHPVVGVVFSAESTEEAQYGDGYYNARAALYWGFREALDPANRMDVCLPPGRRLLKQLCAVSWTRVRHKGRDAIKLEPKDKIEERIQDTMDEADAVVLAWSNQENLDLSGPPGARPGFQRPPSQRQGGSVRAHAEAKKASRDWRNKR